MAGIAVFRLWDKRPSGDAAVLGLSCDESGIFLGGHYALVMPIADAAGRITYRPRALGEINGALSAAYGLPVDLSSRMMRLKQAAEYMNRGDWVLARIATVQLCVPDLPDREAVLRLRKADALLRFNPNHYPAGSGRGGQFAPGQQDAAATGAAESSADDIIRRKFTSEQDAARNALKHFYAASERANAEYAGAIYRNKDGTYSVTAPTTEKEGNDLRNSRIPWSDVPVGGRAVASYHTHLRTDTPNTDENFSLADEYAAQHQGVRSYIATPSGRLRAYDGNTRLERDLGPLW